MGIKIALTALAFAIAIPTVGHPSVSVAQERGFDDRGLKPWQRDRIRDIDHEIREAREHGDRRRAHELEERRESMLHEYREHRERREDRDERR